MGKGYISEIESMSNKLLYVIMICGCILLFSPDKFLESIGLVDFRIKYRPFIGATTLVFTVFAAVRFVYFLVPKFVRFYKRWQNLNKLEKKLKCLTKEENDLIKTMYANEHKMTGTDPFDKSVLKLLSYGIIELAPDYIVKNIDLGYVPNLGNIEFYILTHNSIRLLPRELKSL